MNFKYIILVAFVIFFIVVGIDIGSRYFGNKRPFSKGFYRKNIAGRIMYLYNERGRITLKLNFDDSSYFFNPGRDPVRVGLSFFSTVQKGDSLWKLPMSDTVYTLGKNGIEYKWPFNTQDQFGRSYLEEERNKK